MRQPDIEIYLKDVERDAVSAWLAEALGECSAWQAQGQTFKCRSGALAVTWLPKAVGKWHSLYLEGDERPWQTDLDCATAAHAALGVQVRCAPGGWQEDDSEENDHWLKVDAQGISEIVWKTD